MPFIAPVVTAVAGAFSAVGTAIGALGFVGKALLGIGLSFGAQALSGALGSKPKGVYGSKTSVEFGSALPRSIIFGTTGTAGHFIYKNEHGKNNKFVQLVYLLSDWECVGLEGIWVDGEKKTLVQRIVPDGHTENKYYTVSEYNDSGEYKFEIRFFAGKENQSADAVLVAEAKTIAGGKTWDATSRLAGLCYVSITLWYEDKLFPQGVPSLFFAVKGAKLYDWRKDDTAGGSGAQRWSDPDTWSYSENPAVCEYNFRRGFFRNGALVLGMGVPAHDLLIDHYTAAANACDEEIEIQGGGTQERYICAAVVDDDVEYRVAVEAFTAAMGGYALEHGGQYAPVAGVSQSVVATIADGDLIDGHDVEFSRYLPRTELGNAFSGVYTAPGQMYEQVAYPALTNAAWEALDGGERIARTVDLPSVPRLLQAMRIRRARAREVRSQARATIHVGLRWIFLEPGDWITWASALHGSLTYRITGRELLSDRTIRLSLSEISGWVYGDDAGDTDIVPTVLNSPGETAATTVTGLALQAVVITGGKGQKRPAIRVTWDPPEDKRVKAVTLEYRVENTIGVSRYRDDSPEDGAFTIVQDVLAATTYQVRATIETRPPRVTQWTPWISLSTANVYEIVDAQAEIDAAMAVAAGIRDEIFEGQQQVAHDAAFAAGLAYEAARDLRAQAGLTADTLDEATTDLGRVRAELREQIEELATSTSYAALVGYAQREVLKETDVALAGDLSVVSTRVDDNAADITTERLARTAADTAFATQLTTVEATVADNAAAIVDEATVRASADDAIATTVTALTATVGDNTAAISAESVARATADDAIAATVTALTATVGDNTAAISAESVARATADDAFATQITTLQADVAGNAAAITNEATVRASADSAISATVNTHTTTLNSHTATLTQHAGSIDGIKAQYGVQIALDNQTGGFLLTGIRQLDGSTAFEFLVDADLLVNGSITGLKIAANTIVANKLDVPALSAITANIGTATAGLLKSFDGLFQIQLDNTRLLVADS